MAFSRAIDTQIVDLLGSTNLVWSGHAYLYPDLHHRTRLLASRFRFEGGKVLIFENFGNYLECEVGNISSNPNYPSFIRSYREVIYPNPNPSSAASEKILEAYRHFDGGIVEDYPGLFVPICFESEAQSDEANKLWHDTASQFLANHVDGLLSHPEVSGFGIRNNSELHTLFEHFNKTGEFQPVRWEEELSDGKGGTRAIYRETIKSYKRGERAYWIF